MKIINAILGLGLSRVANAVQQNNDIYHHEKTNLGPSMWLFSPDGLTIYSPDGEILKSHRKSQVCPFDRPAGRGSAVGARTSDCNFFDVASDGHKYVWAANMDIHRVDIYDIDTGDYAGYTDTCSTPIDLNYHPTRQELWIRCAAPDDDSPGVVDVVSTQSISTDHPLVSFNTSENMRAYGRMETHSTMGNYGFATQYNNNQLTKFDLSSKKVISKFEIPKAYASYDMTYSHANEHVFASVRVCCSCGTPGVSDLDSCGAARGGGPPPDPTKVLVQTGPSKSDQMQDGVCSGGCKGSVADTVGVIEFDTVNGKFVGEHNSKAGNGVIPFSSPDGSHIMLAPYDGGKTARILKVGRNGAASTLVTDIAVDMKGGKPGEQAISDVAFVQDGKRNFVVIAGSVDNDLVIADMDDEYRTVKISLSANTEATAAGNRQVEWAVGSDYVWINGGQTKEMYIVELGATIDDARVFKTLTEVPDGLVAYVENYAKPAAGESVVAARPAQTADVALAPASEQAPGVLPVQSANTVNNEESTTQAIAIAGLIVACLALLGVMALVASSALSKPHASASANNIAVQSGAAGDSDTVTLGSKNVA